MRPLNYAILKFFTTVDDACADDVMDALRGQYGGFRAFTRGAVVSTLMTAEVNGLLEESRFELDADNNLRIYYRAHAEGAATINRFIKD